MKNIFTLIAYTEGEEGWYDRCGEWNEGTPSELDISYFTDIKECGFMWAYTERQYETTKLLINGIDPETYNEEFPEEYNTLWNEAKRYCDEQSNILKAEHDRKEQERLENERKKKEEAERLRIKKIEDGERETLRRLQLKYHPEMVV